MADLDDVDLDQLAKNAIDQIPEAPAEKAAPIGFTFGEAVPVPEESLHIPEHSDDDLDNLAKSAIDNLPDQPPAAQERGIIGKAYDWWKNTSGDLQNDPILGSLVSNAKESLQDIPGVASVGIPLIDKVVDTSNRLGGTALSIPIDAVGEALNIESLKLRQKAYKQMAAQGLDINDPLSIRNWLPVGLVDDIAFPAGKSLLEKPGQYLQQSDNKNLKEVGEVLEGFSGATGIIASLLVGAE